MGSKKLKALVVRGHERLEILDSKEVKMLNSDFVERMKPAEKMSWLTGWVKGLARLLRRLPLMPKQDALQFNALLKRYGTSGIAAMSAETGDAPVKNWGGAGMVDFPQGMVLSGDNVNRRMEKKYGCWHCPDACGAESHAWNDQENQAKIRIAKREGQLIVLRAKLAADTSQAGSRSFR